MLNCFVAVHIHNIYTRKFDSVSIATFLLDTEIQLQKRTNYFFDIMNETVVNMFHQISMQMK